MTEGILPKDCPTPVDISSLNFSEYYYPPSNTKELWEQVVKGIAYAAVFIMALVGNVLVIFVVGIKKSSRRSSINAYLVNLAVADLLIALFCMWMHLTIHFMWPQFLLGPFMCKTQAFVQVTALTSSVLTLTAISCDRFVAVLFPLRARFTKKRPSGVITIIWLLSIASSTPFFFHRKFKEIKWKDHVELQCGEVWPGTTEYNAELDRCIVSYPSKRFFYTLFSVSLVFLPVTVMSVTYSLLMWKLCKSRSPGEHQSDASLLAQVRSKRRVIKMVLAVITVFLICWMPVQIISLYSVYGHSTHDDGNLPSWLSDVEYVAYFVAYSNSAANPIIYCGFNEHFRRHMIAILSCRFIRSLRAASIRLKSSTTHVLGMQTSRGKTNGKEHELTLDNKNGSLLEALELVIQIPRGHENRVTSQRREL